MTVKLNSMRIHELAEQAFLIVARCEKLSQEDRDFSWNNVIYDVDKQSQSEKNAQAVIRPFIDGLGDKFSEFLSEFGYRCSVIVYFIPGTWAPLPVFVSINSFTGSDNYRYWKDAIKQKALQISEELRHSGMPNTELNSSHQVGSHMFFFAHQYVSMVVQAFSTGIRITERLKIFNEIVGNSGLSLWIDLKQPPETQYKLLIESSGTDMGDITWIKGRDVPLQDDFCLISPIFLNEDTMVLMTSYFDRNEIKIAIKSNDDMRNILGFHGSLARQVFSPLYTAMLRGDMARLRVNLKRTNISGAVLDCAAKYLSPNSGEGAPGFSYSWKADNDIIHYSDDFRWHIYGDIIQHPDSVFKHVLFLEQRIYENLQKNSLWNIIPHTGVEMALPSTMPLSSILRSVEELGRDLGTTDRDHILHQFHVFILGTLLIKTEGYNFLSAFSKSLKKYCNIVDETQEDDCLSVNDEQLILLLKSAWFLVSTCHDTGRPVQMVDSIVDSLREKVGELVRLDINSIGNLPKFRLDCILYDDPRTYLLLRELASVIANWLDSSDSVEDWWYFFRYMAFEEKHHAFASTLSLGLALTEKIQRHEFASLFEEDCYGRFIASQILLPIVLHHAYDWIDDLETLEKKARKSPSQKKKNVTGAIETIRRFLQSPPSVKFEEFPLAVLLAVTDYLQEDNRPSGTKEKHWPNVLLPDVKMWLKKEHLNLSYKSTLQYPNLQHSSKNKNVSFQKKQQEDISKKLNRSNSVNNIFDINALKNISIEAKCLQFGDHSTIIFNHEGESFTDN